MYLTSVAVWRRFDITVYRRVSGSAMPGAIELDGGQIKATAHNGGDLELSSSSGESIVTGSSNGGGGQI